AGWAVAPNPGTWRRSQASGEPAEAERVPGRVGVDLERLARVVRGGGGGLEHLRAQGHHVGLRDLEVLHPQVQVHLLRGAVRPVGSDVLRIELDADPGPVVDEHHVPVVVAVHGPAEHTGPEGALGLQVGTVEDDHLVVDLHPSFSSSDGPGADVGSSGAGCSGAGGPGTAGPAANPFCAATVRTASITSSSDWRGVVAARCTMETVRITGSRTAMMSTPAGSRVSARSETRLTPSPLATIASAVACSSTSWLILGSNPLLRQAMRTARPKCDRGPDRIHGCSARSARDTVAAGMTPAGTAACSRSTATSRRSSAGSRGTA